MQDRASDYARAVLAGDIVAGPWVRKACERHLCDLEEGAARKLRWELPQAHDAIAFIECLTLADGEFAGLPFGLAEWQAFIVGSLFGWLRADGTRRFTTAYIEVGKGNGKTPLAAGLQLYRLVREAEPGAEVYSAATTRDQAAICFRDAKRFAEGSPALLRRLNVQERVIHYPATGGVLRPLAAEGKALEGKRVSMAVLDELHEHPNSEVVDKMRRGTKGRRNSLIVEITNSGHDRTSICWDHHDLSRKVLDQVIENDGWFAYVCALDEGDDWLDDPGCWLKTNPNLGVSIPVEYLETQVQEARDMPTRRAGCARLNFCVWTEGAQSWIDMEKWRACNGAVDADALRGRVAYAALDLSSTADITAFVLLFPPLTDDEQWRVLPRLWVPEATVGVRTRKSNVPYQSWVEQGFLQTTPGDIVDYEWIKAQIQRDAEAFELRPIAYDRWNATQLVLDLQALGIETVGYGQGYASMSAPTKELERMVLRGQLAHGGHPALAWMASNVALTQNPAGDVKPDKARSKDKVDGIVALIMALGRSMTPTDDEDVTVDVDSLVSVPF